MRKAIIAVLLGLTGTAVGAEPDKGELARSAKEVLKTHCYRCHGQDGVFEGGLSYILDTAKLIARKKIVPGKPDESPLMIRIHKGTMPPADETPRPGEAEKAILSRWIAAGAPSADAAPPARTLITSAELFRWMLDDLQPMDRRSRRFVRYFSIAHLFNQGLSDDELQSYRNALSKLVNSLSWHPTIQVPVAVDPHKTLLRIDLRWYMWDANIWNRVLAEYPYGILDDGVTSRAVMVGTATKLPLVRADWFIATACRPPLYFDMLQLPTTVAELERQLRIDAAVNIQQERVIRLGFNGSGVSKNNRILERHDSVHGAYWRTYDFEAVPQNLVERGGLLPDQRNIFAYPLGPAGVTPRDPFLHAGGESIFELPNGLHGFMIYNSAGNRIDKGPVQIVSDPKRPDRAVETGVSCMSCHLTGINPKVDQVRDSIAKNPNAFNRVDAEIVRALYPPATVTSKRMAEDAAHYRTAVEATGAKVSKTEPVSTLTLRYEADVDLPTAAAEAGFAPEVFRQKINDSELLTRNLGALRVDGGTVSRQVWVQAFGDLVRDLKLGNLFANNVNGGSLPDNTGDLDPLEGSSNQANAAAFTRDGRLALIAGADRSLKLWDVQAEREVRRFVGHTASVWAVAFSADERLALSGGMDGTMRLWDVSSGQELRRFDNHLTLVSAVAFAEDGSRFASGGYDGTLAIIEGGSVRLLENVARYIHGLAFSPDGKTLLVAADRKLLLIDTVSGKVTRTLAGHTTAASCVAFSPDGRWAASGSDDGNVRVWNLESGKWDKEFAGENGAAVRDIAFAPSGKALATAGADRVLRLLDLSSGKVAGRFDKHGDALVGVRFVNGAKATLSASRDSVVKPWSLAKFEALVIAAEPAASVAAPAKSTAVAETLQPESVIAIGGTVGNMMLSPNRKWLFLIDRTNGQLVQIDAATAKVTRRWDMPDAAEMATLGLDGRALYVLVPGSGVIELDPVSLNVRKRHLYDGPTYDLAAGDNGLLFLSGNSGGWSDIVVFDTRKGSSVGRWGGVWTRSFLAISPDGSRLYAASQGVKPGKIEGYPIPVKLDEKPTASTSESSDPAPNGPLTISPDGRWLFSRTGATFRLGNVREDDLQSGPKLPPHLALVVDPARRMLLLLTADGASLKRFSYPELKWQASYSLPALGLDLAFDSRTNRAFIGVIDRNSLNRPRARGFGDVHVVELKDMSDSRK